ncbi:MULTISPECIES: ABC transporter permease [unclassified Streptococcus]|uniref:ABC transporter permease n=1 Tax=unclassified Streptococcus TaxID=2608887 RepID=UPI0010727086|nr:MULTISPECIES: ABC transporter permease [unclassified Streptococcus]MBF0805397.1 ABC transporter permease [Streptococcus sp. 19428wA2_WM07]TFU29112.1 ABC transporter permease [Streptococcus sp. WM07]
MILSVISQGLLWAILGMGLYLTFRILKFPDMTTEGSFPLGGAVAVSLITAGVNPLWATLAAAGAGALAGFVTGMLYTKGRIPIILAGILVMTSCHSIMLMVMGRSNLGLLNQSLLQSWLPFTDRINNVILGLLIFSLLLAAIIYFLNTRLGQAFIATGDNPDMAQSFGIETPRMEVMGLILSNAMIGLAGALVAQQEGYADISRGIGIIVIGLASIIIGEVLFKNVTLPERLISIGLGAVIYQILIWVVLSLGFNTNYLRLYNALILAFCLIVPQLRKSILKGVRLNA